MRLLAFIFIPSSECDPSPDEVRVLADNWDSVMPAARRQRAGVHVLSVFSVAHAPRLDIYISGPMFPETLPHAAGRRLHKRHAASLSFSIQ